MPTPEAIPQQAFSLPLSSWLLEASQEDPTEPNLTEIGLRTQLTYRFGKADVSWNHGAPGIPPDTLHLAFYLPQSRRYLETSQDDSTEQNLNKFGLRTAIT